MARLTSRQLAAALSVVTGALLINVSTVSAQAQGRFRVLVPDFKTPAGAKSKNGEKLGEQLRRQINTMNTHAPLDTDDSAVKAALKQFGLKDDEMDCIKWVQLASQKQISQLVLCGDIDDASGQVTAKFQPIGGGEAFEVAPFNMTAPEQGAQQIVQAFGTYIQQLRVAVNCQEYIQSQSWQQALDACTQVTQLNPRSIQGHGSRAVALEKLEKPEEAFAAYQKVLEIDQINQDAMLAAGLLAAKLNQPDVSQKYFKQYLEFDPENESVRIKIASDLNTAGDPVGALKLMEEWTSNPKASIEAHQFAGFFAAAAAVAKTQQSGPSGDGATDAKEFYNKAIVSFEKVVTADGDSVEASVLRQLMIAYRGAGDLTKALDIGRRATTAAPTDASIWNIYAEVLKDNKMVDEALAALDKVAQLDPTIPQIPARKATLLFGAERYQEMVDVVKAAMDANAIAPEISEQLAAGVAFKGFELAQAKKLAEALPFFPMARTIAKQPVTIAQTNFFEGYTLLSQAGIMVADPSTTAADARRAKPLFEKARELLQSSRAWEEQASNRATMLDQVTKYLERVEAIIKIGK